MHAEVRVDAVERAETRNGKTRWVLRDQRGTEYTTFRPRIGEEAERHRGNVYLDAVEPLADGDGDEVAQPSAGTGRADPDEVAWNTAVEAAPWLVGTSEPKKAVPPDELYERLEPFKRRVAEDIREDEGDA